MPAPPARITFGVLLAALLAVSAAGCAKLKHMKELLLIKGISDEQKEINRYVELKNERVHMLYSIVESGDISQYPTVAKVRKHFGEPVRIRPYPSDPALSEWVYREQTKFFGSPQVFLYFDEKNALVDWKTQGGDDGKGKP